MADDISSPLLSLIRDQGMVDDLQYEEIVAEIKRSGTPVFQIIQDFSAQRFSFANCTAAFRTHADVAGGGNAQGFAQGSGRVAEDGGFIKMVNNGHFTASNNLRMRL